MTRAGGAVGFPADAPEADIRALAEATAAEVRAGTLHLSARGGTGLPAWYAARGWTEVGRFPGALRLGPDDVRDEHWFQREIRDRRESVGPSR
ncbi:hypothetical protein GCM10023215_05380 [Pseudonocardia yuanmonensis]|uniref:GNAT family N-acetyltransferase n=1 Tax=Pseudonocardia yuanmonensis TaxID=1095914 RepID=A0ABP8VZG0_9PSEU